MTQQHSELGPMVYVSMILLVSWYVVPTFVPSAESFLSMSVVVFVPVTVAWGVVSWMWDNMEKANRAPCKGCGEPLHQPMRSGTYPCNTFGEVLDVVRDRSLFAEKLAILVGLALFPLVVVGVVSLALLALGIAGFVLFGIGKGFEAVGASGVVFGLAAWIWLERQKSARGK